MPAKRSKNITEKERPSEVLGLPEDVAAISVIVTRLPALSEPAPSAPGGSV